MSYSLYIVLSIFILGISLLVQFFVNSSYKKYKEANTPGGITPEDLIRIVQSEEKLNISLEGTAQDLGDHYDPFTNVLRISQNTANTPSLSAVIITAHELGHAIQDRNNSFGFKLRNFIANSVSITTNIGYVLFVLGLMISFTGLAYIGLALFSISSIFLIITFPIEVDASLKARKLLKKYANIDSGKVPAVNTLLIAAGATYLVALSQSIIQFLYLSSRLRRND